TPTQLAVLYAAAHGSLLTAGAGPVASALIELVPSQMMVNRICGMGMGAVAHAALPSPLLALCTVATARPPLAVAAPPLLHNLLLLLAAATPAGALGWLAGLWLTPSLHLELLECRVF